MTSRTKPVVLSTLKSCAMATLVLALLAALGRSDCLAVVVERGPYLQMGTPTSIVVRWRTDTKAESVVRYGESRDALTQSAAASGTTKEHVVSIDGLVPSTQYYYAIGTTDEILAGGDAEHFFVTSPENGVAEPTRIWVLGDSGTADSNAAAVRDAYLSFTGNEHTDIWLMLGDNAYSDGTDSEYQDAVFEMYPGMLRKSVLWPTLGNHDGKSADSSTQSGVYYDIFTLPAGGEAGGLPSGTEAYYSFDRGNIHFVCLESHETDRSKDGAMMTWLQRDLEETMSEWIIAFWHHPPYSQGSHNSDRETRLIEMRENALPILEAGGVDLVLSGHSHSYERSFLIDGHYGDSSTLDSTMIVDDGDGRVLGDGAYTKPEGLSAHSGAVYIVAGSSGKVSNGSLNHPVMFVSLVRLGSLVIDVDSHQLSAGFLDDRGRLLDEFTIIKQTDAAPPAAPEALDATETAGGRVALTWKDGSVSEDGFDIERSVDGSEWTVHATVGVNVTFYEDGDVFEGVTYAYRVRAFNVNGFSAYTNTASVTMSTSEPDPGKLTAVSEETFIGVVTSGSFLDTHSADGVYETIKETKDQGRGRRPMRIDHRWMFELNGGSEAVFHVKAFRDVSKHESEGFLFSYSTDGVTFTDMLVVSRTRDSADYQTFQLPEVVSGPVHVRVRDTNHLNSDHKDTLNVDHMFIDVQ